MLLDVNCKNAGLLLLVASMLFSSCTYDKFDIDSQMFTGKVLDYSTNIPVPGAVVRLMRTNSSNYYFTVLDEDDIDSISQTDTIADSNTVFIHPYLDGHFFGNGVVEYFYTTSDASGNYQFIVPSDETKNLYNITSSKQGYVNTDNPGIIGRVLHPQTNYSDFTYLDKASILHINFHDMQPASLNDTLIFNVGFSHEDHIGWGGLIIVGSSTSRTHKSVISNNSLVQYSDSVALSRFERTSISYSVYNNGIIREMNDSSITLIEFGTKVVDIYY